MSFVKKVFRRLKRYLKYIIELKWVAYMIGFILPIKKNKIVVCVNNGLSFDDNCKYIVESILKSEKRIEIILLLQNCKMDVDKRIKVIKYGSFKSIIEYLTAAVWIDNSRKIFPVKKRKTLYIQTWHGGGMYKKIEASAESKLPISYLKIAKKDSKLIDIFISESRAKTRCFYNDFWYDKYVYEVGNPRNDIIINSLRNIELKSAVDLKVRDYFNLDNKSKIVLYAPTFRKNGEIDSYISDFDRLIETCEKRFKGKFVVLLRLHVNILDKCKMIKFSKDVINASYYGDTQELLIASDVLITDYSSINYDFSFTKKPSFRYATDIDDYMEDRGFYYDIDTYPYPLGKNMDELCDLIMKFDYDIFEKRICDFQRDEHDVSDGNASKKCAELIIDYINNKDKFALVKKYDLLTKEKVFSK